MIETKTSQSGVEPPAGGGGAAAAERSEPEPPKGAARGVTVRAILTAIVLTILFSFWVRQAEIVVIATQVTESVPPIPALSGLLLLILISPLLNSLGRRFAYSAQEMLVVYCFVSISISFSGPAVIRYLIHIMTTPFYFGTPENHLSSLYHFIPPWLAVKNTEIVRQMYERSFHGIVPWGAWIVPILAWSAFFMVFWFGMLCLTMIVRHRWTEVDRLSFPIVQMPLEITGIVQHQGEKSFFRNPLMWAGFGLAAVYNITNIVAALFPGLPSPGKYFDVNPYLTTPPFTSLQPFQLHYRPELIGFGFLVPNDICFSIWFFYLLSKLESFFAYTRALSIPGMPFEQEQGIGGYLLLGVWYLWLVRRQFVAPLRNLITKTRGEEGDAPPWAVIGLLASFAFLCWFCVQAGMNPWLAAAYLGIVLVTALVSARIRAEAGIPLIWLFPFYQQKKVLLNLFGTAPLASAAMPATLTIFALLVFLARGYFPALIGYQIESLKIADTARIPRSRMLFVIVLAAVVGLACAFYIHLTTYYQLGAFYTGGGMWGHNTAYPEFNDVVSAAHAPLPPDMYRTAATGFGALLTLALLLLRRSFVGFPLHPLGFAVSMSYGIVVWWSFFVVWVIKAIILRFGGVKMYQRAIPLFLGFALGHFITAGVVWGLIGAFWPDSAHAYGVWFGLIKSWRWLQ